MADVIAAYRTEVSGFWSPRHTLWKDQERLGVLTLGRRGLGPIASGDWRPEKGEVLHFRRDPGILRSQFSLWTEGHEWLGSSLRWSFFRRDVSISTGNKPHRLMPLPTFGRGWRLVAPKTGELARIRPNLLGRGSRIEVYRKVDFELLLFAYFLAAQLGVESLWPAHAPEDGAQELDPPRAGGRTPAAGGR